MGLNVKYEGKVAPKIVFFTYGIHRVKCLKIP